LQAIDAPAERPAVRFSFSRFNTLEDIRFAVDVMAQWYNKEAKGKVSTNE
jgi:cysteine sulfinate desulfinase/cysteine desulfurase-like protein